MHLVPGTLLFAELVKENIKLKSTRDESVEKYSLHVIDALRLGNTSLADLTFNER